MCAHSAVFQSWSVDWSHCPACHGGSPVVQTATGHRGGGGGGGVGGSKGHPSYASLAHFRAK